MPPIERLLPTHIFERESDGDGIAEQDVRSFLTDTDAVTDADIRDACLAVGAELDVARAEREAIAAAAREALRLAAERTSGAP